MPVVQTNKTSLDKNPVLVIQLGVGGDKAVEIPVIPIRVLVVPKTPNPGGKSSHVSGDPEYCHQSLRDYLADCLGSVPDWYNPNMESPAVE